MLKYIFPLSYPKKSVLKSAIGYFLVYFFSSLTKGTLVYFFGEGTTLGTLGGAVSLASTVYIFIGLLLLCFDHLKQEENKMNSAPNGCCNQGLIGFSDKFAPFLVAKPCKTQSITAFLQLRNCRQIYSYKTAKHLKKINFQWNNRQKAVVMLTHTTAF